MTWDDDRKACAFVTAKDPNVLSFAKNVEGTVRVTSVGSLDQNLLAAMAIREALSIYGLDYVIDPSSPYIEFSKDQRRVDFLQFPRQTLEYRAARRVGPSTLQKPERSLFRARTGITVG